MTRKTNSTALSADYYRKSHLLEQAGFRHAFLTRQGGVSKGVFASLNFTTATGDSEAHVRENLRRVAATLGVDDEHIYYLSQVHGTEVHVAKSEQAQKDVWKKTGDIVLCADPNAAAAIRTADCVPLLLACRKSGWVAACHSGWQGCVKGAAQAAVRALLAEGASDLIAAIGPHISANAFEVGEDVAQQLLDASPNKEIVDRKQTRPRINLRKMVRSQLLSAGLKDQDIDDVEGCTVLEPEWYFSYRRDKNPSGRLVNLIVPSPR